MAVSRRAMSRYIAEQLIAQDGSHAVLEQLAAYLIEHRQTKQLQRYIDDIERELSTMGVIVADVYTARELRDDLRVSIKQLLRADSTNDSEISLREHQRPELIGGVLVRSAGKEYDRTIKSAIRELRGA